MPDQSVTLEGLHAEMLSLRRLIEERLPLDLNRAYSDAEVCVFLGGISRTTLWRIRQGGSLEPVELYAGGMQRTTGKQIAAYLRDRERAADVLNFTGTGRARRRA